MATTLAEGEREPGAQSGGKTTGTTNLSTTIRFHSRDIMSSFAYWRTRDAPCWCNPLYRENAEEDLPRGRVFHKVFHRYCEELVTRDVRADPRTCRSRMSSSGDATDSALTTLRRSGQADRFRSSKATAPGPDIWRASVRVFDAAVAKAYGGAPRDRVARGARRREGVPRRTGNWLPDETLDAFREYLVGIKGPLTTPVGGGIRSLNVALRQELDLVRVPAAGPLLQGHGDAGEASGSRGHGDLPREHRRHLRRHRVSRGHAGGRGVQEAVRGGLPEAVQEDPLSRDERASASSRSRARAASA